MSAYTRMEEERDALEEKVEELERRVALLLPCWIKATEERDALMAAALAMQCADVTTDEIERARALLDAAIAKAKGGE
jgi:hypothetical protein